MTPVEIGLAVTGGLCYVGLEYWLGKTDKVKANSTLEAFLHGAKFVCSAALKRKL